MFLTLHMVLSLSTLCSYCEDFWFGSLIRDYCSKIFALSSFWPWTEMFAVMVLLLFAISFVLSALISFPYLEEALPICLTRLASLASFPAIPSMSSANLRFVMFLPPMLTVPVWFSRASLMIHSRWMLKSVGGTEGIPDELLLGCGTTPVVPWANTALVALVYICWMLLVSFWPMLYFFIVAHSVRFSHFFPDFFADFILFYFFIHLFLLLCSWLSSVFFLCHTCLRSYLWPKALTCDDFFLGPCLLFPSSFCWSCLWWPQDLLPAGGVEQIFLLLLLRTLRR